MNYQCKYYRREDGSVVAIWTADGNPIGVTDSLDEKAQQRLPHEHEFMATTMKLDGLKPFGLECVRVQPPQIGGVEAKEQ